MILTLDNFKSEISSQILTRGRDYYQNGAVIELDEIEKNKWQAQVSGSEIYEIEVSINSDNSITSYCDCPYDWGPFCKHEAAVLYAIEEAFPEYFKKPVKPRKQRKKRKTKKEKMAEILASATKEDMYNILLELSLEDRYLYNQLEIRFGIYRGKSAFSKIVKSIIKKYQDRYEFIDYQDSRRAATAIRTLFNQASDFTEKGQIEQAIFIYQSVIEQVTEAIAHADDSNGDLGGCIGGSIFQLSQLSSDLTEDQRKSLFEYLLVEALEERYSGWDWGWELAQIAANLISSPQERQQAFDMLDQKGNLRNQQSKVSNFSRQFDRSQALKIKLSIIGRQDRETDIEQFLIENLWDIDFREKLVYFLIERERLEEAKKYCADYLSELDEPHRFYSPMFLKPLLEIAAIENDHKARIEYARELFILTDEFEYFDLLKKIIQSKTWLTFLKELLTQTDKSIHPQIYLREDMGQNLLASARQMDQYALEKYRKYLETNFPQETSDIYAGLIYGMLEGRAKKRATYQTACRYLRRIQKLGFSEKTQNLILDLQERYVQRRALIDELNKI